MCHCEKCDFHTPCEMDKIPTGFQRDPFIEENGRWYFFDEIGVDRYGPYNSKIDAAIALGGYCEKYLKNPHSAVVESGKEAMKSLILTTARDAVSRNHEHHKMYDEGEAGCGYDQSELYTINQNALELLDAALK